MKNRIDDLFDRKKEDILTVYFTAGYPNLDDTVTLVKNLSLAGADLIEIGFPFSDPLADGPVIQASSLKAIENGMTLKVLFDQLQALRKVSQIPVVLMGYLNPILQFGEDNFFKKCSEVGIDGLILPDMPLSFYENNYQRKMTENGLKNILLITPETSEERVKEIDSKSGGFIYMVSSNSITGSNKKLEAQVDYYNRIKSYNLVNPTQIGFGIHNHETYTMANSHSNGAIIGSAFIKHISDKGVDIHSIQEFVNNIKS